MAANLSDKVVCCYTKRIKIRRFVTTHRDVMRMFVSLNQGQRVRNISIHKYINT